MPKAVYHAYGYVKKAAAIVNRNAGKLPVDKAKLTAVPAILVIPPYYWV
jgi:fumarate hydratase class II